MTKRLQYPIWAAIDPEALGEEAAEVVTLDEFQAFSLPVIPIYVQQPDAFIIDPVTLGAVARDELQWFQPLSEPMRRIAQIVEGGNIFVDEPPAPVFDDELEWFQPLSDPIWPPPDILALLTNITAIEGGLQVWGEEGMQAGAWIGESAAAGSWSGESAKTGGWAEEGSEAGSWSEEGAASKSWTEEEEKL